MFTIDSQVRRLLETFDEITGRIEPLNAATYELEIGLLETGLGVMSYLQTVDPSHLGLAGMDTSRLLRCKRELDRLADTPELRGISEAVAVLSHEYCLLAQSLLARRDELSVASAQSASEVEARTASGEESPEDRGQRRGQATTPLEDEIRLGCQQFLELRQHIDDLLSEGIQFHAGRQRPLLQIEARQATARLRRTSLILVGIGSLITLGAAALILWHYRQSAAAAQALLAESARRREVEASRVQLLGRLVSAQEHERARLARELHDETSQELTGLVLGLNARAKGAVSPPPVPPDVCAVLRRFAETAGTLVGQVRTLAWELHPAVLDHLGLPGALTSLFDRWSERTGIRVDFHQNLDEARLPTAIETVLYRVAQEALTNVRKHAQARTVSVVLTRTPTDVRLVVEDDGCGFEPEALRDSPTESGGLGLLGMRERATLAGGQFEVESQPGAGTTIVVRIPLLESLNSQIRGQQVKFHSALRLVQGPSERGAGEKGREGR